MRPVPDWPIRDLLSHRVAATPGTTAAVDAADGSTWTFRELDRLVDAAASRLRSRLPGSPDGDGPDSRHRIAVAATTDASVVLWLFAAWRTGAIAVPIDGGRPTADLERRLDRVDADVLVGDVDLGTFAGNVDLGAFADDVDLGTSSDGERPLVSLEGIVDDGTSESHEGNKGSGGKATRWEPDESALCLFTSGTTGSPKGVRITHRNLVASATGSAFRLGLDPAERWLDCLPTNHMGGLAPIVRSVCYGTTVVLQRSFDRVATARAMDEHDVTAVSMVPTQLRRLLDDGWTPPKSLRFVLLGGAPAGPELLADCEAAGVPVRPTYGSTETASQIATARPGKRDGREGTVGPPLVVADVTIVDPDDGQPVDAGETGELVVDGPIVGPGYLDDAATEAAFGEYGLHTGDLASRDDAGRLTVHGRLDDAIQTGGETVHPWRVVDALGALPEIDEVAVVGLPDPEWGERVCALVVPRKAVDVDEILATARTDLADYEVPKTVRSADQLPRTDSGTVDRGAVRECLREFVED